MFAEIRGCIGTQVPTAPLFASSNLFILVHKYISKGGQDNGLVIVILLCKTCPFGYLRFILFVNYGLC